MAWRYLPIYGSASVYLPQLHLQLHVSFKNLLFAAQSWAERTSGSVGDREKREEEGDQIG
jgi:hypothetical protein